MDSFDDDPFEPSSSSIRDYHEKVEENVHHLLEQGWFFGKLLSRKTRTMFMRCYSDPSQNFGHQEILADIENSSSKKLASNNLMRAPSLPPCLGREKKIEEEGESSSRRMRKLSRQLSDQCLVQESKKPGDCIEKTIESQHKRNSNDKIITGQPSEQKLLLRTPSLPPIGREEEAEEEENDYDITMSRLILQAMPPRHNTSKGVTQCSSMLKYRPPKNLKVETNDTVRETRNHVYSSQRNLKKILGNLETIEVQGFKDFGSTLDKQHLNPSAVGVLPVMQDQDKVRRGIYSEAWNVQSCASPIPIWAAKNSSQDMKAQLKCWAKAVASNVR